MSICNVLWSNSKASNEQHQIIWYRLKSGCKGHVNSIYRNPQMFALIGYTVLHMSPYVCVPVTSTSHMHRSVCAYYFQPSHLPACICMYLCVCFHTHTHKTLTPHIHKYGCPLLLHKHAQRVMCVVCACLLLPPLNQWFKKEKKRKISH